MTHAVPMLTIREVAKHLRVKPATVVDLITNGSLPAYRIADEWRIRQSELELWLIAHESDHRPLPTPDLDAAGLTL